jgi:hypothetical protein
MPMSRAPRQLLTGGVTHSRPIGRPETNFGRTLKIALKRNGLFADFATWSTIARGRSRWRLLTHYTPTPSPPTPTPPIISPPTPNQPPTNPSTLLPGYENLAPAYDLVRAPHPTATRRNARRRPRFLVRCARQPRQCSTSAAPSCARHRARQLKKKILNTFPIISGCFVLGCRCFVARIYYDGQYF